MKQFFIAAFTGLISLAAHAQVTETRIAKEVSSIEVKNGIEVIFTQSDTLSLQVISNSRENLSNIITNYSKGKLTIFLKDKNSPTGYQTTARVYVSQKSISAFTASTGASIRANGKLNLKDLAINLSSGATVNAILTTSGKCNINVKSGAGFRGVVTAKDFSANIMGGSYIKITGNTGTADVYCSGGSLNAGKFVCNEAKIWAQKASAVSIYTNDFIEADTDASSSVIYYGEPARTSLGANTGAVKRDNYKLTLN